MQQPNGQLHIQRINNFKEFFEDLNMDLGIDLIDDELYPYINEKMCIGCGACAEISLNDNAVELDRYIGPIVHSRNLDINHEACGQLLYLRSGCKHPRSL